MASKRNLMIRMFLMFIGASANAFATGNAGSFSAPGPGRVDYQHPAVARPALPCQQLATAPEWAGQALTSELMPANGDDPEFCRVTGTIPPAVRWVVYMPNAWNGRLYMHGNGGDAGESLDHAPFHRLRMTAVRKGFGAVFTNSGHDAATQPGAVWAYNDAAREADYGYRAVHLTARVAKEIMGAYYGTPVHHAYFDGCSTGGRQGMMEAQRFPDDFDGILAGAPVFDLPDMLWQYQKNSLAVSTTPISLERLKQLGDFIRSHHDRVDGIEDGVIGNPLDVDFVPSRDLPRAESTPGGFTADELRMLDILYAPVVVNGVESYPRTVVGSELPGQVYERDDRGKVRMESAWVGRVVPNANGQMIQPLILESWFRYLAFEVDDPARDWKRMDPARDGAGMARMRQVLGAADPNLHAFASRGGKLILYHGWADFGVNPLRTIQYFDQLAAMSSLRADDYLRLYLVPGMFHCSGGTNVDYFDLMSPLIDWVEAGQPPATIPARRIENGKVTRTRPLCPHPQISRYNGQGDSNDNGSFTCTNPTP